MTARLLILGGTRDAVRLAECLNAQAGYETISSLAGRVAQPLVPPGRVRIGGFGGADGLAAYLAAEHIDALIDATHPFAARISANAAAAAERARTPLLALHRTAWEPVEGDRWHDVRDVVAARDLAAQIGKRIFLTIGRTELAPFEACSDRWFLIRTVDPPTRPLPAQHELVLQRGPFVLKDELELMRSRAVDTLVTKNSGGAQTSAKLEAARTLGIPVVMIVRPTLPTVASVDRIEDVLGWLVAHVAASR